jgi:hypothetical protein
MGVNESKMPQPLNYLSLAPDDRSRINPAATLSIACGSAALVFLLSMCVGVWQVVLPSIAAHAGFVSITLAITAVVSGGIGALRAERDSAWYNAALIGYALGMFVGTLSPVFFMV